MYGAIGQIVLLTIVAGLLAAGITLPAIAIAGLATRDTANTFNNLPVGTLGNVPQISTMYDVEGKAIAKFYPGDIYRVPVTYDQIAPIMRNAIVAIEDSTFYTQGALDPRGTARALFSNSSGGQLQGASTLAQQYVKNVRLLQAGNNKAAQSAAIYPGFSRKITQLRIAATVEHSMSQKDLLAAYLNVAFFGEQAYGIQVAAERYFSVPASKLTLIQAADLAGIVQSPTAYDPRHQPGGVQDAPRRSAQPHDAAALHQQGDRDRGGTDADQAEDVRRPAADRMLEPAGGQERVLLRLRRARAREPVPAGLEPDHQGHWRPEDLHHAQHAGPDPPPAAAVNYVEPH